MLSLAYMTRCRNLNRTPTGGEAGGIIRFNPTPVRFSPRIDRRNLNRAPIVGEAGRIGRFAPFQETRERGISKSSSVSPCALPGQGFVVI